MTEGADADRLHDLGMFASVFAGRPVAVDGQLPGEPPWTDGQTVFIDTSAPVRANLEAIAVQASMIAAGSLDRSQRDSSATGQAELAHGRVGPN